jgi:hypothetical protein
MCGCTRTPAAPSGIDLDQVHVQKILLAKITIVSMRCIMKKGIILGTLVGAALLTAAPFSLLWSQKTVKLSLDSADARIGRPLTPLSVAGVHRRAHRRAVYGTAAAFGVGSYYGASGYPGYSYSSYGYPASGYGSYYASAGYPGYGYGSYGYPASGYGSSYASGYPGYGYGGYYRPGYRVARRVAIHRARWH